MGCALKGVESKVIGVPWFLVVWYLYPRAAVCLPESTNPILHSAGDLCHSAFIVPANCFTIFTRSHSFVQVPFKYQQLWYKCLLQWRICLLVDVRVCGVECDHAVALIDDAEYGNNCGCGPAICGVR